MKYEEYILNVVDDATHVTVKDIPKEYLDELKNSPKRSKSSSVLIDNLPEVFDQGRIGSCVGAAMMVALEVSKKLTKKYSVMWIYNNAKKFDAWKGEDYSGTSIAGASTALKRLGCCEENYWPYQGSPQEGAVKNALDNRILGEYAVYVTEEEDLKAIIDNKEVLVMSLRVYDAFYRIGSNGEIDEANYLKTKERGGHAVAVVGYSQRNGELYWRCRNSWGSGFGLGGDFFISHHLLKSIIKNQGRLTYVVTDPEVQKKLDDLLRDRRSVLDRVKDAFRKQIHMFISLLMTIKSKIL